MVDASDKEHPENWTFQVYMSWKGPPYADELNTPQERLHFFREHLSRFCEPWRTAGLALKEDEIVHVDRGAQFSPYHWDSKAGRVTLAGDAAHAMLPRKSSPFFARFLGTDHHSSSQTEDKVSIMPSRTPAKLLMHWSQCTPGRNRSKRRLILMRRR